MAKPKTMVVIDAKCKKCLQITPHTKTNKPFKLEYGKKCDYKCAVCKTPRVFKLLKGKK